MIKIREKIQENRRDCHETESVMELATDEQDLREKIRENRMDLKND
jgi:hypothetical protein